MEFCPNCHKHLFITNEKNSHYLQCIQCGYSKQIEESPKPSVSMNRMLEPIIVINPDVGEMNGQAVTHIPCPQCSNQHAYYLSSEVNEEEIILFRCTHCHFVWREAN
jgi:DNA-directed RNA polymerase subunit M/transcription elongation factor TFIIS